MLEDAKTSFLSALHLYIQRAAQKVSNILKSFFKRKRHAKKACLFLFLRFAEVQFPYGMQNLLGGQKYEKLFQ